MAATPAHVTQPPGVADADSEHRVRQDRMTAALQRLRSRSTGRSVDRWLAFAGGVLLPLGGVLVLLGWYGAAHTTRVYLQIPYLISGGLLGLGMMFAGGFCYFAFWVTRLIDDQRSQSDEALVVARDTAAALTRIETLLASAGVGGIGGMGGMGGIADGVVPRDASDGSLVVTRTGSLVHRSSCAVVANRDDVRVVAPDAPGLVPCRICEPELA
jgi:hypothetical protein